jgi:hypothetical protein
MGAGAGNYGIDGKLLTVWIFFGSCYFLLIAL